MSELDEARHVNGQEWRAWAACRGMDTNLWFPEKIDGMHQLIADARAVCRTCTVTGDCLDYAMAQEVKLVGVWGGLSERERKNARRTRRHLSSVSD